MKAKEIRRRTEGDLREEVKRLEKTVFEQRFHGHSEEKSDRGLVRRTRRDVARILTVLRERELGDTAATAAPAASVPAAAVAVAAAPAPKAAAKKPAATKPAAAPAKAAKAARAKAKE